MATIVNNPGPGNDSGGSSGTMIALIAIIVLALVGFFIFSSMQDNPDTMNDEDRVNVPASSQGTAPPSPNVFNTTLNSTTTVNNSTTTNATTTR